MMLTLIPYEAEPPPSNVPLSDLLDDLLRLQERIITGTERETAVLSLEHTAGERVASILNLLNYVVMRREDLRPLQERLAAAGLSSLGRGEPHVLTNINRVIDVLSLAVGKPPGGAGGSGVANDPGHRLLRQRSERMFGCARAERSAYILVTLPTDASINVRLVEQLIAAGMDTARINCAHDDTHVWLGMLENLRHAASLAKRSCPVLMELGGHKIRTANVVYASRSSGKLSGKTRPGRVRQDDWLVLCKQADSPETYAALFEVPVRAVIACTCPDIIDQLHAGETAWIDDGKIGTVIRDRRGDAALLQVNRDGPRGARIKPEKGLNFPETRLNLPTLSDKDKQDLEFVSQHADLVGLSFTERADDVLYLQSLLQTLGAGHKPIIAKIETATGVHNLPQIICRALAANIDLGIMIARGDLAIELGSVRMAEVQEEILWLCETAHIPVIWATQVLESLAKKGVASRAEITDAAMSVRADCVMLNKGVYIEHAVGVLGDVLQRMEAHQFRKISRMRALHW
jgi:pyruvate kinase